MEEAIRESKTNSLTHFQIKEYISKFYKDLLPLRDQNNLRYKIQKILRRDNTFQKCGKNRSNYLWRIACEVIDENVIMPLKHIGKFIDLPLVKCTEKYDKNIIVYNSLYNEIEDMKAKPRKYNFEIKNVYDFNRAIGDYLRNFFSIQKTFFEMKADLLEGKNIKYLYRNCFVDLDFPLNFEWKNVDYDYVNKIVANYCKKASNLKDEDFFNEEIGEFKFILESSPKSEHSNK
ncbi:hypothetical protein GVAV_002325 [Gurleya vavrai]